MLKLSTWGQAFSCSNFHIYLHGYKGAAWLRLTNILQPALNPTYSLTVCVKSLQWFLCWPEKCQYIFCEPDSSCHLVPQERKNLRFHGGLADHAHIYTRPTHWLSAHTSAWLRPHTQRHKDTHARTRTHWVYCCMHWWVRAYQWTQTIIKWKSEV